MYIVLLMMTYVLIVLTTVKPEDNLRPEGQFYAPEKSTFHPAERPQQVRPKDNLKTEGKFEMPVVESFSPAERPKQVRREDNLKPEGKMYLPEKTEFKSAEKRKQVRHSDNLSTEGEMHIYKKNEVVNRTVDKTNIIRQEDNLKVTGKFVDMIAKNDYNVTKGERAKVVKQEDNLKMEGKFTLTRSSDDYGAVRAEKVVVVKTKDNLKLEGNFEDHMKRDDYTVIKGERVEVVKHPDNLKLEGDFDRPQQPKFESSPRPKAMKPADNLKITGDFEGKSSVQKTEFKNVKGHRSEIVKHTDQITLNTGTMSKTTTNSDSFDKKTAIQSKQPRKNNMQSSISLGSDTNTMKTTNQMNYTSTRNVNKQNVVYDTKNDRSDSNGLRDGTIAVTTMKVTTVLSNDKKQGPQPPEIIKTSKQTRVHEETNRTSSKSTIVNQTNIINESNIVNQVRNIFNEWLAYAVFVYVPNTISISQTH